MAVTARAAEIVGGRRFNCGTSANLSKPGPTTFEDVAEDMDGRIDAIVRAREPLLV